jgi:hypothetical protein
LLESHIYRLGLTFHAPCFFTPLSLFLPITLA